MSISEIVAHDRCMICGGCYTVCAQNAISMHYDNGFYKPIVKRGLCIECGLCEKICPSLHQRNNGLVGNYIRLALAHSTNEFVRMNATSGGVINSLIRYIIDKKIVDAVLVACFDSESRIETGIRIITLKNVELLSRQPRDFSSRYVSIPLLEKLNEIVRLYRKIAVVGTSCQINAVNNYLSLKPDSNILKIGITCSGGISYVATEEYKKRLNAPNSKIFYRGEGWPGKNTLVSGNQRIDNDHLGSLFERMFSSQIFKNPGCRYCQDLFAEEADISFCDFWNHKEKQRERVGNTCVIVRSENANQIFESMVENGYIDIVSELTFDDITNSQKNTLNVKKGKIRSLLCYKCFWGFCRFVYKSRIYTFFGRKQYNLFCIVYAYICSKGVIL